jgi:hypothetical protein
LEENHCKDCCCAQTWKALGITGYTGRSIPEHIIELRNELARANDICEWDTRHPVQTTCGEFNAPYAIGFKHCPFCGRRIHIKGV